MKDIIPMLVTFNIICVSLSFNNIVGFILAICSFKEKKTIKLIAFTITCWSYLKQRPGVFPNISQNFKLLSLAAQLHFTTS